VEGRDPRARARQQLLDPFRQLARRLVGEGDREDPVRRDAACDERRHAPRDDARLARAGAGDDQERAAAVQHGGALRFVQVVEERRRDVQAVPHKRSAPRRSRVRALHRPRGAAGRRHSARSFAAASSLKPTPPRRQSASTCSSS
jgi:hypothetical protein